jgi:DNA-binding transcriptional regulator GbsR (MarR family)
MTTKGTDIDTFKQISQELSGKVATAKGHIETINKSGEPKDNFVSRMTEEVKGIEKITNNISKQ